MDEYELDFESFEIEEDPEYTENLYDTEEIEVDDEAEADQWEQEYIEPEPKPKPEKAVRKPRRKKIVIPPNAHPLEAFILSKEFGWGELTGITGISRDVLMGVIHGNPVTDDVKHRVRLTTGVKLCG